MKWGHGVTVLQGPALQRLGNSQFLITSLLPPGFAASVLRFALHLGGDALSSVKRLELSTLALHRT
eukprot:scaffold177222_cov37-Tisochrysis_lutea.AAC.2